MLHFQYKQTYTDNWVHSVSVNIRSWHSIELQKIIKYAIRSLNLLSICRNRTVLKPWFHLKMQYALVISSINGQYKDYMIIQFLSKLNHEILSLLTIVIQLYYTGRIFVDIFVDRSGWISTGQINTKLTQGQ